MGCAGSRGLPRPQLTTQTTCAHSTASCRRWPCASGYVAAYVLQTDHAQSTRVIYVSTDTDAKTALAAAAQYPWLRMLFFDDSDFAPMQVSVTTDVVEVARGEEFVQASVSERAQRRAQRGGTDAWRARRRQQDHADSGPRKSRSAPRPSRTAGKTTSATMSARSRAPPSR